MKKKLLTYEHPELELSGMLLELMIADSGTEMNGDRDDFDFADWSM